MQFSIRTLFAIALFVAVAFSVVQVAPLIAVSIVLLVPLPALIAALNLSSIRRLRRLLLGTLPFALLLFYIGLVGPMCAVVAMPDAWGFVTTKDAVLRIAPLAYPWFNDQVLPERLLSPLASYQEGWAAWVNPAW